MLVRRIVITMDQHFDGLLTQLTSRHFALNTQVHGAELEDAEYVSQGDGTCSRRLTGFTNHNAAGIKAAVASVCVCTAEPIFHARDWAAEALRDQLIWLDERLPGRLPATVR